MQIEKKHSHNSLPPFIAARRDMTVAKEHASLFQTQLALARWTRGGDIPHVHASERAMPMRAAWFAQAQQDFQSWLNAGGFQQPEHVCLDCARRETRLGLADDSDEHIDAAFPVPGIANWPAPGRD